MKITENVEVIVPKLRGFICNKCGNAFDSHDDNIQSLNTKLGQDYGDCKFELCSNCILEIFKDFLIVPTGFMSDPTFTSSFDLDHDLHQNLFNEWKIINIWNCDENPYRDYYENYDEYSEEESYDEFDEENENIEVSKPVHSGILRLVE